VNDVVLYRLSLTNARLQGMFPNPANDNNFRLVLGGHTPRRQPKPSARAKESLPQI